MRTGIKCAFNLLMGNKRAGRFMSGVCERRDQELTTIGCGIWFCWNDPGIEYTHVRVR